MGVRTQSVGGLLSRAMTHALSRGSQDGTSEVGQVSLGWYEPQHIRDVGQFWELRGIRELGQLDEIRVVQGATRAQQPKATPGS